MNDHDDDARPWTRRRKQAATTAVGLTALLGVGAYLITAQVVGGHRTTTAQETGAQTPLAGPSSAAPVGQGKGEANPEPGPTPSQSMTVDERIKAARAAAAKDGHPVQHALSPAPGIRAASDIMERNEKVEHGSLRIITARSDLSGQRELMWAADNGKRYGHVMCTKNFKFANNQTPAIRANMLLCWRTSAKRSVATVLIDYGGHPSTAKSAAIIDREWAKLG
jgi:hypothetical protein